MGSIFPADKITLRHFAREAETPGAGDSKTKPFANAPGRLGKL